MTEHLDVVVVGAGLSGIGAAYHLQTRCPGRSFAVLEGRDSLGGTWDLFRYPGIRSDSDMNTLGFAFRPWTGSKVIADGPSILSYLHQTVAEHDLGRHIRFTHRVRQADWFSAERRWHLQIDQDGEQILLTCGFLFTCSGYYDYAGGHTPEFAGRDSFAGEIIHPQAWPEQLELHGKRVVVIGSGATAVTLVPALVERGAHPVMLQRSPTYVVALPSVDRLAERLRPYVPGRLLYKIVRWRNILLTTFLYWMARAKPAETKARIAAAVRRSLGPDYDVATHFTPRYEPWDQRVCLVPDGDLFRVIRRGAAEIVTDEIERFTPTGLRLKSGRELAADIVVTATGLNLQLFGGMSVSIDGVPVEFGRALSYRGLMYGGVPNMATTLGYTNASWTLKADLTAVFVCRLLNHMAHRGYAVCVPRPDPDVEQMPLLDFTSGYVRRSLDMLPKQGRKRPWRIRQNYLLDLLSYRFSRLHDGTLRFQR